MKNILIAYYSQTGQLKKIVKEVAEPLEDKDFSIDLIEITTEVNYPFPWKDDFYSYFPETILEKPHKLSKLSLNSTKKYDLIILAVQPWFLSPSQPVLSFLNSEKTAPIFKNTQVITIYGARNMWVKCQETIKEKLINLDAKLVGNIVLQDRHNNLVSAYTIVKWLIHGKKGPHRIFPMAGISEADINSASKYGNIIKESIQNDQLKNIQDKLLKAGAVKVKYHLAKIEFTAYRVFVIFAKAAEKAGIKNKNKRKRILKLLNWYLLFAIFIISPIVSLLQILIRFLFFPIANKRIAYYCGVKYIK